MNVLTLVVAVAALVISLYSVKLAGDSNAIAREANELAASGGEARVEVAYDGGDRDSVYFSLCRGPSMYEATRSVYREVTFVNRGGRAATLLDVSFSLDDEHYHVDVQTIDGDELELPLDIEPGLGREWQFRAYKLTFFDTTEAAMADWDSLKASSATARWVITLSNGEIFTIGPAPARFALSASFEEGKERSCYS